MSCANIREKVMGDLRVDPTLAMHDGPFAEHLAHCAECREYVKQQMCLAETLRNVRRSAGDVPESLDAAVLDSYRRYVVERVRTSAAPRANLRPAWALRWGLAAAVLAACVLFFVGRRLTTVRTPAAISAVHSATVAPSVVTPPITTPPITTASGHAGKRAGRTAKATLAGNHGFRPQSVDHNAAVARLAANELPGGFRGLMFCDPLSCSGAMDVIRVQLPPTVMARPSGWPQTGVVTADVLVGSDGIARGIRIVQ